MALRVAAIGLGRMGTAMAARLIERGHTVCGWNRTVRRTALPDGLVLQDDPAAAVAAADIVLVSLLDEDAADSVYRGEAGILSASLAGRTIIDTSTLKPVDMQALADAVTEAGGGFVACPVAGTIGPARAGRLIGLAGGDPAALDRAAPILDDLCERVERFDTPAAAAAVKLAVNLPLLVAFQALGEAALLVRDHGVDQTRLISIIAASPGAAPAIGWRAEAIVAALQGRRAGAVEFPIEAVEKDLRLIDEAGRKLGYNLPVTEATRRCTHDAAREGWSDHDLAALVAFNLRG